MPASSSSTSTPQFRTDELLGLSSFTVDFAGQTTTGKTTALELAASVWGNPREIVANWHSTKVYLEHLLALARGVPTFVDETSLALTPELVRDLLYAIPTNRQRGRGAIDGTRRMLTWQTVVLTTGEQPITSFTRDAGTLARTVALEASPFGDEGGKVARQMREGCMAVYGVAGPAFVAYLVDGLARKGGQDKLRARHRELAGALAVGGDLQQRRAPYVAALALAAELAHKAKVVPFAVLELDTWLELFGKDDERDDRPAEALGVIRDFVVANPLRILGHPDHVTSVAIPPPAGWAGKWLQSGTVAVSPRIVEEELRRAGYALDAVKGAWAKRGLIRRGKGSHLTCPVRVGTTVSRWMVFEELVTGGVGSL